MTEYDYSPEAYDRYLATQNRIANWVDKTERHRAEYQSANSGPSDLTRSGPAPASYSKLKRPSPPLPYQHPGQSQPNQLVIHPPSSDSSSSSSDSYEVPPPPQMRRPSPGMVLPQMQPVSSPPPVMSPAFLTSPHKTSHHRHHRHHRSHDHRRSRSHHSPGYYTVVSPPLSPAYQYTYPGGSQGYPMMPQYGTQMPVMSTSSQLPRSAPASVTSFNSSLAQPASYFQPQVSSIGSPQPAWSPTYGVPSPAYPMMSTPTGSPLQSPQYPGVPTFQSFAVPQPTQPSYIVPMTHQRVHNLKNYR